MSIVTPLPALLSPLDPGFEDSIEARLAAEVQFSEELAELEVDVNAKYNTIVSAANAAGGIAVAVSTAAAAAAAAAASKDLAVAAWAASTAPAEKLAALSQSLHIGAVVDALVYDTSKDSDGGAWRQRCQDKSWYTETLGGDRWIGQQATIAAAWAAAGSATGAVFLASATAGPLVLGKYYAATSAATATEVFRGITRDFPAAAGIVAEGARVVIYDLSTGALWMVFARTGTSTVGWWGLGTSATSVAAASGKLLLGFGGSGSNSENGLRIFDFVSDRISKYTSVGSGTDGAFSGTIATRPTTNTFVSTLPQLVNSTINDVAITVLDGAPIDPATGMPVPTIAVATAGGVSVIKDNGAVVNMTPAAGGIISDIAFTADKRIAFYHSSVKDVHITGIPASTITTFSGLATYNEGVVPAVFFTNSVVGAYFSEITPTSGHTFALGKVESSGKYGLTLLQENPATPAKGMAAYISDAYTTGWLPGDIRGAWLADTVAETITASGELVTNGTFATDTSGWGAIQGAVLSVDTARLKLTNDATGTASAGAVATFATVIGKTYAVSVDMTAGTAGSPITRFGTTQGNPNYLSLQGPGTLTGYFVAITALTYITTYTNTTAANAYSYVDNISVKLAEPDRSIKGKGLVVNGTLTKTAVAAAAALVAYSGFSAANFLEQPYTNDLDFGTGDLYAAGWVNMTSLGGTSVILHRSLSGSAGGLVVQISPTTGFVQVYGTASTAYTLLLTSTVGLVVGVPTLLEVLRADGILYIKLNGNVVGSVANTTNLSYVNAVTRLGVLSAGTSPCTGSLALWRISATAPSADQSAHIYRTELPLFQAGAQCTIAGTSTAVTALAYDDATDLLHVGTSWGRSGFKDLLRVDSEATTTGALTSLSAQGGTILTGGTSGKVYVPAKYLRDELRRKDEAAKALGKVPVFFDFDAASFTSPTTSGSAALTASSIVGTPFLGMGITGTGIPAGTTLIAINGAAYTMSANATVTNAGAVAIAQSSFTLQQGYTAKAVYSAGALKRLGSTKDYLAATDGFRETINFGTSPGSAVWVSIMAIRSN